MQYKILGKTGLNVSRVLFSGLSQWGLDQNTANDNVSYAIDKGINFFDVAPTYGDSEAHLGISLKPYRDKVYLACKTMGRTAEDAKKTLENSLKLLNTDHFDLFQLHYLHDMKELDIIFGKNGAMETLLWAKKEGYIRHIGFSAHVESVALKALELYDFETVLYPVNFALWLAGEFGKQGLIEVCKERNIGFMGMKTLAWRTIPKDEEKPWFHAWYKPITDEALGKASIKYALEKGCDVIAPPGCFKYFAFAAENIDECINNPITYRDMEYLKIEAEKVKDYLFMKEKQ